MFDFYRHTSIALASLWTRTMSSNRCSTYSISLAANVAVSVLPTISNYLIIFNQWLRTLRQSVRSARRATKDFKTRSAEHWPLTTDQARQRSSLHGLDALFLLNELLLDGRWQIKTDFDFQELAGLGDIFHPVVLWKREQLLPVNLIFNARYVDRSCTEFMSSPI